MEGSSLHLNVETVVAVLFGLTALATVVMTSWAYIYQRTREIKNEQKGSVKGDQGQFFVRIRPRGQEI